MKSIFAVLLLTVSTLVVSAQSSASDGQWVKVSDANAQRYASDRVVVDNAGRALHCTLESERTLKCVYKEEGVGGFTYTVNKRHPWAKVLTHLRPGMSTVTVVEHARSVCLVETNPMGGWAQNSASRQMNVCVKTPKQTKYAHAQQKAVAEAKPPIVYSLNAEASEIYSKLEEGRRELVRQYEQLQAQQHALMVGAGVPKSELLTRKVEVKNGIVSFVPPEPKEK